MKLLKGPPIPIKINQKIWAPDGSSNISKTHAQKRIHKKANLKLIIKLQHYQFPRIAFNK